MAFYFLLALLSISLICLLASAQDNRAQWPISSSIGPGLLSETVTLDNSWFSDDSTDSTTILIDGDLTAIVPVSSDSDPLDFGKLNQQTLQESLPYLLQEFGVEETDIPGLVTEAIPLIYSAIAEAIAGPDTDPVLHSNDLAGDIGNWIAEVVSKGANIVKTGTIDVGCGVFGGAALSAYQAANGLFAALNAGSTPVPTTNDEDFLIYPLHGSISHDDGIVVYYDATFAPTFGAAAGVTMGKNIYVRYSASASVETNSLFPNAAELLLHEFTHSKQYQSLGYSTIAFGTKYMFQFCKGGFKYENIAMEVEAYNNQGLMDGLRIDPIGKQFLHIYNSRGVDLGLPTARTYIADETPDVYLLPMQGGTLSITCSGISCS